MNYNSTVNGILSVLCIVACVQAMPSMRTFQMTTIEGHHCHNRRVQVFEEIEEHEGQIISEPAYVPRCKKDGIHWQTAQCDHKHQGRCFCVYEEDGLLQRNTEIFQDTIREELRCDGQKYRNENGETTCRKRQQEFKDKRDQWDINADIPLPYFPECSKEGSYMGLQRDDSKYFCVDTRTGYKIPDTEIVAGTNPPLTEGLCQSYSEVWNQFKQYQSTLKNNGLENGQTEARNQKSCKKGLVFKACGCPKLCTPGAKAQVGRCDNCKPACVCPDNQYLLNGHCISLEKCHTLRPASDVLHADKLDTLTNGLWKQYQEENPNAVKDAYAKKLEKEEEEEEIVGSYQVIPGVAHDFISSFHSPMEGPVEEGIPDEGQQGTLGLLGAEVINKRGNHNEGGENEGTMEPQERINYGEHGEESDGNGVTPDPEEPSYEKPTGVDFNELFNPDVDETYEYNTGLFPEIEEDEEYYNYEQLDNNGVFNYEEEGSSAEEEITMGPAREEEEMVEHQRPGYAREFPILPELSDDEAAEMEQEFLEEPPCDEGLEEDLEEEEFIPTESEIAQTIYKVLEANNILKPEEAQELLANFENPKVILKKQAVPSA